MTELAITKKKCSIKPEFHLACHVTSRHARHVVSVVRVGLISQHARCPAANIVIFLGKLSILFILPPL